MYDDSAAVKTTEQDTCGDVCGFSFYETHIFYCIMYWQINYLGTTSCFSEVWGDTGDSRSIYSSSALTRRLSPTQTAAGLGPGGVFLQLHQGFIISQIAPQLPACLHSLWNHCEALLCSACQQACIIDLHWKLFKKRRSVCAAPCAGVSFPPGPLLAIVNKSFLVFCFYFMRRNKWFTGCLELYL